MRYNNVKKMKNKKIKSRIKSKFRFFIFLFIFMLIIFTTKIILSPKIKLIEDRNIKIQINSEYHEDGFKCKYFFKDLEENVQISSNLDTSKCGKYDISYNLYNEKGKVRATAIRHVEVYDDIPPVITLYGDSNIKIFEGKKYREPGYKVVDNSNEDISNNVTIEGKVDTSKIGSYELTYKILDSSGNESKIVRNVEVVEMEAKLQDGLPVLMYHFFYDDINGQTGADANFMAVSKFDEQMKYLKDNNFYFPDWDEVEDYIEGNEDLPQKSIVITIDDGNPTFFKYAIPIIEKYNIKVTSFVITSWLDDGYLNQYSYIRNLNFESHSHDMHRAGNDGRGRMMTLPHDKIVEDLKKSSDFIGKSTVFCYPFGHVNKSSKAALKDADYTLAFTTKYGRVRPGMDKLELPRIRMSRDDTITSFINRIN